MLEVAARLVGQSVGRGQRGGSLVGCFGERAGDGLHGGGARSGGEGRDDLSSGVGSQVYRYGAGHRILPVQPSFPCIPLYANAEIKSSEVVHHPFVVEFHRAVSRVLSRGSASTLRCCCPDALSRVERVAEVRRQDQVVPLGSAQRPLSAEKKNAPWSSRRCSSTTHTGPSRRPPRRAW